MLTARFCFQIGFKSNLKREDYFSWSGDESNSPRVFTTSCRGGRVII
jgi:hypothetical protein